MMAYCPTCGFEFKSEEFSAMPGKTRQDMFALFRESGCAAFNLDHAKRNPRMAAVGQTALLAFPNDFCRALELMSTLAAQLG